jgi:alkaline phosphatase D
MSDPRRALADVLSERVMDRRRFLAFTGALAGTAAFAQLRGDLAFAAPPLPGYPFSLGVASGDPLPNGISLWTRLAPEPLAIGGGMPPKDIAVQWQVASDRRFRQVVKSGTAAAVPELAHSVHVDVGGLDPGRQYFYRFLTGADESPVGRTRTAPAAGAEVPGLRFAFASCQKWDDGFYTAYRRMAQEDLDLVVHLGDYIYEYGVGSGGVRNANLPASLGKECVTLERYRQQHALYKTDGDLQEVHRIFPWAVTWDDHEVANDYSGIYPEFDDTSQWFLKRRAAAYQAWFEHMSVPLSVKPTPEETRIYRQIRYGNIAEFNVLDTRQYRTDNPCGDGEQPPCDAGFDPNATMTGAAQEAWLLDNLERSNARWNVIAQGVLMGQLKHDADGGRFWNDSWDGWPGQRARILGHIADAGVQNPVVITGDWHSTFVNNLKADYGTPDAPVVATEFVGTSISSNGDCICYGPYYGPMIEFNPDIQFFDGDMRGYVRCTLDHDEWRTDLRMVPTVSTPDAPVSTFASFVVEDGVPGATKV